MIFDFTVVINNYNHASYLGDAIESVLRQRDPPRLIVVDDGSTDNSRAIVARYGDRVTLIALENGGQARACLAALAQVETTHVHFLDADDRLLPGFSVAIRDALRINPAKVQVRMQSIAHDGSLLHSVFPKYRPSYDRRRMLRDVASWGMPITPPTSGNVFRIDIFDDLQAGFDYETAIDGVALLLAPFKGEVISVDRPLVEYRIHGKNAHQQHVLSESRFLREEKRLRDRHAHLQRLIGNLTIGGSIDELGMIREMRMLRSIAIGRRPTSKDTFGFLSRLRRVSLTVKAKSMLGLWAVLMFAGPRTLRSEFALWRLSPINRQNPFIRSANAMIAKFT